MDAERSYAALTGIQNAFGWGKKNKHGDWQITLGGLTPGARYTLAGEKEIIADDRGAWSGEIFGRMLRYVAQLPKGTLVLYDEAVISQGDAAILARPKPVVQERVQPRSVQIVSAPAPMIKKEPVQFRTSLGSVPVDALPALVWPQNTQQLRMHFEKNRPVRLLDAPAWRFVRIQGMGTACYVGYLAQDDRIQQLCYAVQARGGLIPPKGLEGYRYAQGADGKGYWMLMKTV